MNGMRLGGRRGTTWKCKRCDRSFASRKGIELVRRLYDEHLERGWCFNRRMLLDGRRHDWAIQVMALEAIDVRRQKFLKVHVPVMLTLLEIAGLLDD